MLAAVSAVPILGFLAMNMLFFKKPPKDREIKGKAHARPVEVEVQAATSDAGVVAPTSVIVETTPAADPANAVAARLTKIKALRDQGVLTEEEYESKRKELLASI